MATPLQENEFLTRYKDDYRDSDNYYRILFNPGRSLQARELTQLQTIIQNEMARFGAFTFKPNALVSGGDQTYNPSVYYVKLDTTLPEYALPGAYEALVGRVVETTTGIKARVKAVAPASGADPDTLIVEFISSGSLTSADPNKPVTFAKNTILTYPVSEEVGAATANLKILNTNDAVGKSSICSIPGSTYFVLGHFVQVNPQTIILSKYDSRPTVVIGFQVEEEIVTTEDDVALYDNSGATPNLASPGADRYRIRLLLKKQSEASASRTFIPAFRYVSGRPVALGSIDRGLNTIGRIMATRTSEESGNYVVNGLDAKVVNNDSDSLYLNVNISSGVAYLNGERFNINRLLTDDLRIEKPRSTFKRTNDIMVADYGSFVLATKLRGMLTNVSSLGVVNLRDSADYGTLGSTIGTAQVRSIDKVDANNFRVHLFNINLNSGVSFGNVRSIGTSTSNYATTDIGSGSTILFEPQNTVPLFPLPDFRPAAMTDTLISVVKSDFAGVVVDGSGQATFTTGSSTINFVDEDEWILSYTDGTALPAISIVSGGAGTGSVTFDGLTNGKTVNLLAYVQKTGKARSKLLTIQTETLTPTVGTGLVTLTKPDILELGSVIDDTTGTDITYMYTLDNGQRDAAYELGRLIQNPYYSVPAGTVTVTYSYFAHGATGDYFSIESYRTSFGRPLVDSADGTFNYGDIPLFRQSTGAVYDLREYVDFRPVKTSAGTSYATKHPLPRNRDTFTADIDYYNGRISYIVLSADGQIVIRNGAPGRPGTYPKVGNRELLLHTVTCQPYVLNQADIDLSTVDNRRYTMADIRKLEQRIQRVEELTSLTLLELSTDKLTVVDENGLERTKLGITADEFKNLAFSNIDNPDFKAGVDIVGNFVQPEQYSVNVPLVYDSAASKGVKRMRNYIIPTYTEEVAVSQPIATNGIDVQQFTVSRFGGKIELSPSTDTWDQSVYVSVQDKPSASATIISGDLSLINPISRSSIDIQKYRWSDVLATPTVSKEGRTTTKTGKVGQYTLDIQRSRFVFFKITGLKPETRHYIFFNNKNVSTWCKTGSGLYQDIAALTPANSSIYLNPGERYKDATSYPIGGPTAQHITSAAGELEGIFFIQSNTTTNFPTGEVMFTVSDVNAVTSNEQLSVAKTKYISAGRLDLFIQNVYTEPAPISVGGGSGGSGGGVTVKINSGGNDRTPTPPARSSGATTSSGNSGGGNSYSPPKSGSTSQSKNQTVDRFGGGPNPQQVGGGVSKTTGSTPAKTGGAVGSTASKGASNNNSHAARAGF